MPLNDGTGPNGEGSKSGRGVGDCEEDSDELTKEARFNLAEKLVRLAQKLTAEEADYRNFFNNKMEEWEIDDPSDLDEKERKQFFNEIEVEWNEAESKPAEADVARHMKKKRK